MHTITIDPGQYGYLMQLLTNEVRAGEQAEDVYRRLSKDERTSADYLAVSDAKDLSLMAQTILRELVVSVRGA